MKNRIAVKFTLVIMATVLVSMFVMVFFFIRMYGNFAFDSRSTLMMSRAKTISTYLAPTIEENTPVRGMGALMRFINTLSEGTVWLVELDGIPYELTGSGMGSSGMGMGMGMLIEKTPLPAGVISPSIESVIKEVLAGNDASKESYSSFFNEATLTVGTPIWDRDGKVLGAVLLQTKIAEIKSLTNKAVFILCLSLLIALGITLFVGVGISTYLSKPLEKMNFAAREISRGNYAARSEIKGKDEVGQLSQTLDEMASTLESAAAAQAQLEQIRKDFIANVSHEFRTPLTVLRGSAEALLDGAVDTREEEEIYLRRIVSETKSLNNFVQDLLDLSKLDAGKSDFQMDTISLSQLVTYSVESFRPVCEKRGITLEYKNSSDSILVYGDYERLKQMLFIFLDNGLKFSSPDGHIFVSLYEKASSVYLEIEDEGTGIRPEDLPFIWDRFYKSDKARTSTGTTSSGLGLSIAKHIIHAHHGEVHVESELRRGTRFTIELPVRSIDSIMES